MARGQVLQIASGTNQTVSTQSREEKNSFVVYNPNDGVCYFKLNGDASPAAGGYDWKLPAQSGGAFGGPWQSLGIYYLDQSGAGRQGEINLHDSDNDVQIPNIWAIGRSLQAQVTSVDLTEGTAPPNPPVGVARLWADNTGQLYILLSDGSEHHSPYTPIGGADIAVPVQLNGTLRSYAQTSPPNTGPGSFGAEMYGQPSNSRAVFTGVDRSVAGAGALCNVLLYGAPVDIWADTNTDIRLRAFGTGNIILGASGNGTVIANLPNVFATGSRINSVPANTVTNIISITLPSTGLWLIGTYVMTQNVGAANDSQQFTLIGPSTSFYMTTVPSLWNGVSKTVLANMTGTTVTLQITSFSTTINIAGDFSNLWAVRIA